MDVNHQPFFVALLELPVNDPVTALLFRGQSCSGLEVAKRLTEAPGAERINEEVATAWVREGQDPSLLHLIDVTDASADRMSEPVAMGAQLRALTSGLFAFDLLKRLGIEPDLLIGHGLGDIAALCAAGGISVQEAARWFIAYARALYSLRDAAHGLLALATSEGHARVLVRLADTEGTAIACVNSPKETLLSGPEAELRQVVRMAGRWGVTSTRLETPFGFSHPENENVAVEVRSGLCDLTAKSVEVPVYSSVLGRRIAPGEPIAHLMACQLLSPVRFADALWNAYDEGVTKFIECGSGDTLVRAASETLSGVVIQAPFHHDFRSSQGFIPAQRPAT